MELGVRGREKIQGSFGVQKLWFAQLSWKMCNASWDISPTKSKDHWCTGHSSTGSDTGLHTIKNMPKGHCSRSYGTSSDWSCLDARLLFFSSACNWNGKYGEGLSEKYALQKIGVKSTKDSGTWNNSANILKLLNPILYMGEFDRMWITFQF